MPSKNLSFIYGTQKTVEIVECEFHKKNKKFTGYY